MFEEAIAELKTIPDYRDAAEKMPELEEKIRQRDYNAAAALGDEGKFEEAILAFAAMDGYSDSAERITALEEKIRQRDYNAAAALEEDGKFGEAILAFAAMNGYSDSAERITALEEKIRQRDYDAAAALEDEGKFEEAILAFAAMNGYSDSAERITALREKIRQRDYDAAAALEAEGNYADAYSAFMALGSYSDSAARAEAVMEKAAEQKRMADYAAAEKAEAEDRLEVAEAGFAALGDYQDSAARAETVREKIRARDYGRAKELLDAEQYDQAAEMFAALGGYEDSASLLEQAKTGAAYQSAVALALQGQMAEAYNAFTALGDYRDSARKAEIVGNLSRASKTREITEGVLIYEFHDLWGIANLNTNVIVPVKYTSIEYDTSSRYSKYNLLKVYLSGGKASYSWYVNADDKYGYIDLNGEEVIPCQYFAISDFNSDGLCTVAFRDTGNDSDWYAYYRYLFGITDYSGKQITSAKWRTLGGSSNKHWNNGDSKTSFDKDEYTITVPQFTDGRMSVQLPDESWGFIDEKGKVLGQVKWYSIGEYSEGLAKVCEKEVTKSGWSTVTNYKFGFIDEKGSVVGEVRWEWVSSFSNGYAAVQENGLWGFIDKSCSLVIPCQYAEVNAFREDGTCDVKTTDGTWLVINTAGEVSFFGAP